MVAVFFVQAATAQFNAQVMERAVSNDFSTAPELADYLAAKQISLRQAHAIVDKLVLHWAQPPAAIA